MPRTIPIIAVAIALLAATSTATAHPHRHGNVNACLRAHGWPYGITALRRAELRVRHPNGLDRTCTAPR